jgi:hypothetical protein
MRRSILLLVLIVICVSAKTQNSSNLDQYVEWIDISGLTPKYKSCLIYESDHYLNFRVRDNIYLHEFYFGKSNKQSIHNIIYGNADISSKRQQIMYIVDAAIHEIMEGTGIVDRSGNDEPTNEQDIHKYIAKDYHRGRYVSLQDIFAQQNKTTETQRPAQVQDYYYDNSAPDDLLDNIEVTAQRRDDYYREHPESEIGQEYIDGEAFPNNSTDYSQSTVYGQGDYIIQDTPNNQNLEAYPNEKDQISDNASIESLITNLLGNIEGYAESIITILIVLFIGKWLLTAVFFGKPREKSHSEKLYEDGAWFHDNHKEI